MLTARKRRPGEIDHWSECRQGPQMQKCIKKMAYGLIFLRILRIGGFGLIEFASCFVTF